MCDSIIRLRNRNLLNHERGGIGKLADSGNSDGYGIAWSERGFVRNRYAHASEQHRSGGHGIRAEQVVNQRLDAVLD